MSSISTLSSDSFDIKCENCPIHCIKDHAILLAENIKLKEENSKLKKQISTLQLDQQEHQFSHGMIITNNLSAIDQCELILKNQALREINQNLMLAINEFKSENEDLKSKVTDLEKNVTDLKKNVADLKKNESKNDIKMRNMAKRIYKFAPIGFRSVIEKILSKNGNETAEEIEYLKLLKQYFSTFVHDYVSNIITPDCNEMKEWIEAMFDDNQTVDQIYRYKNSKDITITLNRPVLDKIVQFFEENQSPLLETEAAD